MAKINVYTDIIPRTIEEVNRIELFVDDKKFTFLVLGNGWIEMKVNGDLYIRYAANSSKKESIIDINYDLPKDL